jgi:FkbM family methyltransferase
MAAASPGNASWKIVDGHLIAQVNVLSGFDRHQQLVVPAQWNRTATMWLDIGINTAPSPFPGSADFGPLGTRSFYLGFEPLLDKYATNIAREIRGGRIAKLGSVHLAGAGRGSGVMVPIAIADNDNQMAEFHVSRSDGCSSLNHQRSESELAKGGWTQSDVAQRVRSGCGNTMETRMVPTVTLEVVLRTWLAGRRVQFMHVDVQGSELQVLRSARGALHEQVDRIMLEVPNPACATLTKEAPSCDEVFRGAAELGFEPEDGIGADPEHRQGIGLRRGFGCADVPWAKWNSQCEFDVLFVRKDVINRWQDVQRARESKSLSKSQKHEPHGGRALTEAPSASSDPRRKSGVRRALSSQPQRPSCVGVVPDRVQTECVWQSIGSVCPLFRSTNTQQSSSGTSSDTICVPIEVLPVADFRNTTDSKRQHRASVMNMNKAKLTHAPRGFERRLYLDLGARTFESSIRGWFLNKYPSAGAFTVHAFEASHAFDDTYIGRKVQLHHFCVWTRNGTVAWGGSSSLHMGAILHDEQQASNASGAVALRGTEQGLPALDVGSCQSINIAEWLQRTARAQDYVVMKMDIEGAEYAVAPHLIESGAAHLIDELFIEVHTDINSCCRAQNDRRWADAMALVARLRKAGVYAHAWV